MSALLHEILAALLGFTGHVIVSKRKASVSADAGGDASKAYRWIEMELASDLSFISAAERESINQLLQIGSAYSQLYAFNAARGYFRGVYVAALCNGLNDILTSYRSTILQAEQFILSSPSYSISQLAFALSSYALIFPHLAASIRTVVLSRLRGHDTPPCHGLRLLSFLHCRSNSGHPIIAAVYTRLSQKLYAVLYAQVESWCMYGLISDEYNEFFIQRRGSKTETNQFPLQGGREAADVCDDWDSEYILRLSMLPTNIIPFSFAAKILFTGKAVNLIKQAATSLLYKQSRQAFTPHTLSSIATAPSATAPPSALTLEALSRIPLSAPFLLFHNSIQHLRAQPHFSLPQFSTALLPLQAHSLSSLISLLVTHSSLLSHLYTLHQFYCLSHGSFFLALIEEMENSTLIWSTWNGRQMGNAAMLERELNRGPWATAVRTCLQESGQREGEGKEYQKEEEKEEEEDDEDQKDEEGENGQKDEEKKKDDEDETHAEDKEDEKDETKQTERKEAGTGSSSINASASTSTTPSSTMSPRSPSLPSPQLLLSNLSMKIDPSQFHYTYFAPQHFPSPVQVTANGLILAGCATLVEKSIRLTAPACTVSLITGASPVLPPPATVPLSGLDNGRRHEEQIDEDDSDSNRKVGTVWFSQRKLLHYGFTTTFCISCPAPPGPRRAGVGEQPTLSLAFILQNQHLPLTPTLYSPPSLTSDDSEQSAVPCPLPVHGGMMNALMIEFQYYHPTTAIKYNRERGVETVSVYHFPSPLATTLSGFLQQEQSAAGMAATTTSAGIAGMGEKAPGCTCLGSSINTGPSVFGDTAYFITITYTAASASSSTVDTLTVSSSPSSPASSSSSDDNSSILLALPMKLSSLIHAEGNELRAWMGVSCLLPPSPSVLPSPSASPLPASRTLTLHSWDCKEYPPPPSLSSSLSFTNSPSPPPLSPFPNLRLDYTITSPLQLLLRRSSFDRYNSLFRFLFPLKRVHYLLHQCWSELKQFKETGRVRWKGEDKNSRVLFQLIGLRQQMQFVVDVFHHHFIVEVMERQYARMMERMRELAQSAGEEAENKQQKQQQQQQQHANSAGLSGVEQMVQCHEQYLNLCITQCFLHDRILATALADLFSLAHTLTNLIHAVMHVYSESHDIPSSSSLKRSFSPAIPPSLPLELDDELQNLSSSFHRQMCLIYRVLSRKLLAHFSSSVEHVHVSELLRSLDFNGFFSSLADKIEAVQGQQGKGRESDVAAAKERKGGRDRMGSSNSARSSLSGASLSSSTSSSSLNSSAAAVLLPASMLTAGRRHTGRV